MSYTDVVSITIEPLSKIPVSSVRDFLIRHRLEPAVIDWKYYDRQFNGERERGFACIDDGRIVSFLGLIPFTVMHKGKTLDAAWSCDWYRESNTGGPLGIMLMRHSLKAYPLIYSSGGSEMTAAIMGRLSRVTVPTAGIEFYKPLRVGGAAYAVQRAAGVRLLPPFAAFNNIRLPISRVKSEREIKSELFEFLPPISAYLLPEKASHAHLPAYDLPYLQWLLGRCPSISTGVCLVSRGDEPIGAVLFWRPATDRRFWRIALLSRPGDCWMLQSGLQKVIHHARDNGGWLISLLTSRLDEDLLKLANRHGFYRSNSRRPLYILAREPDAAPQELEQLTYLDTDYAYRFPVVSG